MKRKNRAPSIKPEAKPQQEPQTPLGGKRMTDVRRPQQITPASPEREKRAESTHTSVVAETASVVITEILAKKATGTFEKPAQTVRKKKDWILIIAIIVFGVLLLIIQFSTQLGIEGFP